MSPEGGEKGNIITIKEDELSRRKGETLSQQKRRITRLIRLVEEQIAASTGWIERSQTACETLEKSVKNLEAELTGPSPRLKIEELLTSARRAAADWLSKKERHEKKLENLHPRLERYKQFRKGLDAQGKAARKDKR